MIKLFELLFYGHVHKWDYIRLTSEPDLRDKDLPSIVCRVYACKRCCAIKRVKV
jgi:hypothetical protein